MLRRGGFLKNRTITLQKDQRRVKWNAIVALLEKERSINVKICGPCLSAKLYDKNNSEYRISWHNSIGQIEEIIQAIKKINATSTI